MKTISFYFHYYGKEGWLKGVLEHIFYFKENSGPIKNFTPTYPYLLHPLCRNSWLTSVRVKEIFVS